MQHNKSEQGQAIVLLVLLIVGLLAAAGLAVDAGRVYSSRRSAQNAADNAALAAALAVCDEASASSAALAAASTNGFNNDGSTNTVVVRNPPTSGPNSGDNEYIEVIITHTQPATLTQLVYKGSLTNTTRAVGHCDKGSAPVGNGYALIIMRDEGGSSYSDPYDRYTLKPKPGGIIDVTGTIFVNSDSPDAYSSYGHQCGQSSTYGVHATAGIVVGDEYEDCNDYLQPNPTVNASAITDPLAALAAPSNPGSCTAINLTSGTQTKGPGCYSSITVSGSAQLTLTTGTYYITGNVRVYNTARMTANNAMLYLTSGDISFEDSAIVTISAPTSGTYKGMAIFMDSGDSFQVIDNANLTINGGTVYAPEAFLTVYGLNSGYRARVTANGSQFIVDSAWVGASSTCIDYSDCTNTRGDLVISYDEDQVYSLAGAGSATIELSE
jgi:hypothetical protein